MKIGVIAHLKNAISEPFAGGLEMHTYCLCKALRRRGHHVTLFAAAGSADDLGLEVIRYGAAQTANANEDEFQREHEIYRRLMAELRLRDFDIIHNNSLHYLPLALAGSLPMPMVTTLHTPPFWEMEGSLLQNHAPNSWFIAVSSFIRNRWEAITHIERVIYNGIDLQKFCFRQSPDPSPYIVWCGRIVPEKGLHLAILAARQAGLHLRIAGPISDPAYFTRDITPLLNATSQYVGHVDHSNLPGLIGGARAFLFSPAWDEPYGLVLAEALACGTPVASFARGAITEILDASCGIAVPPGDTSALARAANDVQRLRRTDCRKRAENIADFDVMIEQYEDLYRHAITQNKPSLPECETQPWGLAGMKNARALLDSYLDQACAISSEIPPGLRQ